MAAAARPFREYCDPSRTATFETDEWSEWVIVMKPQHDGNDVKWIKRSKPHKGYRLKSLGGIPGNMCGIYEWMVTHGGRDYVVYIGNTCREDRDIRLQVRLKEYCSFGSHKAEQIDDALYKGYTLSVRYLETDDKPAAEKRENEYLGAFNYAWNKRMNGPTRYDVLPKGISGLAIELLFR